MAGSSRVPVFHGCWDEEGVYFYQAFNDYIADWALEHQKFGGPHFDPRRMTWIKPSFAWMLYRAGYGKKHNQNRILKVKIGHDRLAELLSNCRCGHGGGGTKGRVQWDPARDIMAGDGKYPRKMTSQRAIQIGFKADLSERYVDSVISIEDVTELAAAVEQAHLSASIDDIMHLLPNERAYTPHCTEEVLTSLGMRPGEVADFVAHIGRGRFPLPTSMGTSPSKAASKTNVAT